MTPTLLTLYGAESTVTDAQIARALVSLARVSPAERAALYRKYPELMGVAPWVSKVLKVAKKVGAKGKKLVSKVKGLVSKARAKAGKARSGVARVTPSAATSAASQRVDVVPVPASRGLPRNLIPIAIAAGAVLVVVLASRKRG